MTTKPKILVIVGPTAIGKSDLAVQLAQQFKGEVISADSRQVYKRLDIGTGKITTDEMQGVTHHLLDVANPETQFSVVEYVRLAEKAISDILEKGKLPIICGGTGFYIQALVDGVVLPEVPANTEVRDELSNKNIEDLKAELERRDPERLENMCMSGDDKNKRRLIRAIEIARVLGTVPKFSHSNISSKYEVLFIGLHTNAIELKERIKTRLNSRLKIGMVEEAQKLHSSGLSWERMEELGLEYRYLARHLQEKMTLKDMTIKLGTEIWRYSKRQMTWFKKNERIKWFTLDLKDLKNAVQKEVISFLG
ncbi:MAG: tRNA (adenosine(37)-N6)-dimethylallyltransferase MiaA [bacterium]|nr:tRNA (adenosine(37)-N6)-dimethylallyltransferase MiaA [bacterium]